MTRSHPEAFTMSGEKMLVESTLGAGTYGTVYKVRSENDENKVRALKMFSKETFRNHDGIPPTTIRELNALRTLSSHQNVVKIDEIVFTEATAEEGHLRTELFYTMELCQGNLKDKCNRALQALPPDVDWRLPEARKQLPAEYVREAKLAVWQLLNGIAFSHSSGVMHRDLKPANVMWDYSNRIKIGDFGLARFIRGDANAAMSASLPTHTGEVQTLWYRAPEVLFGEERYGALVDDWSIGCIMAELFRFHRPTDKAGNRKDHWCLSPLFRGDCEMQTIIIILETLGTPAPNSNDEAYFRSLPFWSINLPKYAEPRLKEQVPLLDDVGLDLLSKLLTLNPGKRVAARYLLDHPWFEDVAGAVSALQFWTDDEQVRSMYKLIRVVNTNKNVGNPSSKKVGAPAAAASSSSSKQQLAKAKAKGIKAGVKRKV
eukprot:GHVU01112341.1.p1 GENE.GHVU01112341.1~~GHVU01112341.1.p1  ORF type:complete len:430 (+),score=78.13 GHVU01112341.1:171-1460(+)